MMQYNLSVLLGVDYGPIAAYTIHVFVGEITTGTIHMFGSEAIIGRQPTDVVFVQDHVETEEYAHELAI